MTLQLACKSCKARKRKCDKALPKCSLCSSKKWLCDYPVIPTLTPRRRKHIQCGESPSTSLQFSMTHAQYLDGASNFAPPNQFPPVFYLDRNVFRTCQVEVPKARLGVPPSISRHIGDPANWETIAFQYFSSINSWLPIISKKCFYEKALRASKDQIRSDYALLILCMDMIMSIPQAQNPRASAYLAAKQLYLDLEIQGVVSLQVLQAGILVALYELGHAIFPSAVVSVDACIRYGYELGINWGSTAPEKKPFSWVEAEEQNRVWWAIIAMDIVFKIGYPRRSLQQNHEWLGVLLPADDTAWDEGTMPTPNLQSHSPRNLGHYALTAETIRLLSQVLEHISAEDFGGQLHGEQSLFLDSTLQALENVVRYKGEDDTLSVMNQGSMCLIARALLHEAHASKKSPMASHFDKIHVVKQTTEVVRKSREKTLERGLHTFESCVQIASPFLTTLLYQCGVVNLRLHREEGTQESLDALMGIKGALKDFAKRWKSAGAYLDILEAGEISKVSLCI